MKTIKATVPAWINHSSYGPDDLDPEDPIRAFTVISFFRDDMSAYGYTRVGDADVTLRIFDDSKLAENAVASLRAEKQEVMAKAQAECTKIEERIQQLLAIAYEPQAAE